MKYKSLILFLIVCLITTSSLFSQDIPRRPSPPRLVNDFANLLQPNEQAALERKLVAYDDSTSTQIAIVIEQSLNGADHFDYPFQLYNSWGIGGSREESNGVLIYVSLKDRIIRIITGYGSEGFLPDNMSKRIIENIIAPAFRQNNYYAGFDRATDSIIELASGEYSNDRNRSRDAQGGVPAIMIIFFLLLLIVILSRMSQGHDDDDDDGGYYRGGRYDMDDYPGRKRRRRRGGGGWIFLPGGGFGGGGSDSGGGFGGFGGFGGGLSGGGGAFGDW